EFGDYIKLRADLLSKIQYNKFNRPVKSHTSTTTIQLNVYILQFVKLDADGLLSNIYFSMLWKDENLVWNASQYNNLDLVDFAFEEVWTPDIIAWNAKSPTPSEDLKQTTLTVNSTGYVRWRTQATLNTYCYINLNDYPFDEQRCAVTLGSWMHYQREINLTRYGKGESDSIYGPLRLNPEWDVSKMSSNWWNQGTVNGYSIVSFKFKFKRKISSFHYTVFMPYLAASLLVIATFWTPIGSKFRYIYTNIAVVIFVTLLIFLSYKIGIWTYGVPYAIRCVSINLLMTIVLINFSSLVSDYFKSLIEKRVNPPLFLVKALALKQLNAILCLTTKEENSLITECVESDEESAAAIGKRNDSSSKWMILLEIIDRCCFCLYVILFLVFHS
ncbi:nicotinic acetylcholine receptor subunit beta3-like protein, partial [Dinothrombium tinctorium]